MAKSTKARSPKAASRAKKAAKVGSGSSASRAKPSAGKLPGRAKPVTVRAPRPSSVPAGAARRAGTPAAGPPAPPVVPRPSRPPPRLTVRTPADVDERKRKLTALLHATSQIKNLKRSLSRSFYDVGLILRDIDQRKLYEVKNYASFEAFLEREVDLGKLLGMRLARAVQVFQREAALQAGLERVSAAVAVFDGEMEPSAALPAATPTSSGGARSPIPFHKR